MGVRGSEQMGKAGLWELEPWPEQDWWIDKKEIATSNQLENYLKDNKTYMCFIK